VPGRQRGDQVPMNCRQRASRDDQAVVAPCPRRLLRRAQPRAHRHHPPLRSGKD
jgi:hypothetical protein